MSNFFGALIEKYSKTVGYRTEVDRITNVALILQRIFGQQVLDPEWTWKKYFIHQFLNLILFIYVFFGTLQCLNTTTDADLVAEACYTLIMIGIFPLKMLIFIQNRHSFRKLYINVKTTLMEVVKSDSTIKPENVLKTVSKIVYILFLMVLVPCSIYELTTLWNYLNGRRVLLSRSTTTLMPMTTPYYEIAWFLHTIFLFEISSTIILDMWFVLLVYFLCIACDCMTRILALAKVDGESKMSYSKRLNMSLNNFYKIHIKVVEYMNTLNYMYKWLAFVPLCNAAMCICLLLLLMSNLRNIFRTWLRELGYLVLRHSVPFSTFRLIWGIAGCLLVPNPQHASVARQCPCAFFPKKEVNWRFAPHVMPMLAEIFAYNWFGEQIKTKARNIQIALINFDWLNLNVKDRKSYLIIIKYINKDFGVKTAIGNDLSLITMTAVLKVSYQAFTVLQTINN